MDLRDEPGERLSEAAGPTLMVGVIAAQVLQQLLHRVELGVRQHLHALFGLLDAGVERQRRGREVAGVLENGAALAVACAFRARGVRRPRRHPQYGQRALGAQGLLRLSSHGGVQSKAQHATLRRGIPR